MSDENTESTSPPIPEEFCKIITDFINDITMTFPEYAPIIGKWWDPMNSDKLKMTFSHCLQVFPERFFDILSQNVEIFSKESDINTEFLPGVSFKYLWQCDISDKTRETIWKYLQLIMVSIMGCIKDKNDLFGNTSKLFESINEDEFKGKLEATFENMQKMFENNKDNDSVPTNTSSDENKSSTENTSSSDTSYPDPPCPNLSDFMNGLPNPDEMQNHISSMLNGKLGDLAKEIAEETTENLDIDMGNMTDMKDIFQTLFKNPGKLMGLVKSVGEKLDNRIKSGDINQSELIAEASEIMNKMKNMPGMDNIQSMLGKMGMGNMANMANMAGMAGMAGMGGGGGGGGGKGKVDVNAMEAKIKAMQTKERMKKKMEAKHFQAAASALALTNATNNSNNANTVQNNTLTDEQLIAFFNTCDKGEKTPRQLKPVSTSSNTNTITTSANDIAITPSDKKKKKNKNKK